MHPPHRQSVARISEELGIHVMTLNKWRKAWRLQGALPTSSRWYWRDWTQRHRAQRLLPRAGPVPWAGEPLAAGGPYLAFGQRAGGT